MAGRKTRVDGKVFDSKLEAEHYKLLKERKVEILKFQPRFELFEGFEYFNIKTDKEARFSNIIYTGDFLIKLNRYDKPIVVEVKGLKRPVYMMRKKLFIMKYSDEYHFFESEKIKDLEDLLNKGEDINENRINEN